MGMPAEPLIASVVVDRSNVEDEFVPYTVWSEDDDTVVLLLR